MGNYVRVPVGLSALLLLVFFPVICGKGEAPYTRVSGVDWEGYAARWLLVSAALFAGSGALYLVRSRSRVEQLKHAVDRPVTKTRPVRLVDARPVGLARRRVAAHEARAPAGDQLRRAGCARSA